MVWVLVMIICIICVSCLISLGFFFGGWFIVVVFIVNIRWVIVLDVSVGLCSIVLLVVVSWIRLIWSLFLK